MLQTSFHLAPHHRRSGFTLVELLVVVVLMGIISVSVIPAMSNIRSMREGAARDDLMRMIEVTKGRAVASGVPHGMRIDLSDSSLTIIEIDDLGEVQVEFDPLTGGDRTINLAAVYPGVNIASMINGDGAGGSGTIWFDYESSPHTRDGTGSFTSLNTQAASVTLSSGERVVVHPHSGTLEVQ